MTNVVTRAGIPIWLYHLGYTNYSPDKNVLNVLIILGWKMNFKQYANHWHLVFGIDNVHLSNFSTATRKIMWTPILMMGTACGNDQWIARSWWGQTDTWFMLLLETLMFVGIIIKKVQDYHRELFPMVCSSPCTKWSGNWYIVAYVFSQLE